MRFGAEVVGAVEVRMKKRTSPTKVRRILQDAVLISKLLFWLTKLASLILNYVPLRDAKNEKLRLSYSFG